MMAKTKLPAFVQEQARLGGLDVGDLEMPRMKLLQASSPELTQFNNAKPGKFWHSLIHESFGSTVRICPTYIDWRFILWRPQEAGGGILARADDAKHWIPANAEFTVKLKTAAMIRAILPRRLRLRACIRSYVHFQIGRICRLRW